MHTRVFIVFTRARQSLQKAIRSVHNSHLLDEMVELIFFLLFYLRLHYLSRTALSHTLNSVALTNLHFNFGVTQVVMSWETFPKVCLHIYVYGCTLLYKPRPDKPSSEIDDIEHNYVINWYPRYRHITLKDFFFPCTCVADDIITITICGLLFLHLVIPAEDYT